MVEKKQWDELHQNRRNHEKQIDQKTLELQKLQRSLNEINKQLYNLHENTYTASYKTSNQSQGATNNQPSNRGNSQITPQQNHGPGYRNEQNHSTSNPGKPSCDIKLIQKTWSGIDLRRTTNGIAKRQLQWEVQLKEVQSMMTMLREHYNYEPNESIAFLHMLSAESNKLRNQRFYIDDKNCKNITANICTLLDFDSLNSHQ